MSLLQITENTVGRVTVFRLSGYLVYDQGTRLLRQVVTRAVAGGARACLVDLEQITYLDSAGVGMLIAMYRHVTGRGGHLKLLRPSPCARRVLGITHLTAVFDIFDEEAEALLNLGGTTAAMGSRH